MTINCQYYRQMSLNNKVIVSQAIILVIFEVVRLDILYSHVWKKYFIMSLIIICWNKVPISELWQNQWGLCVWLILFVFKLKKKKYHSSTYGISIQNQMYLSY